MFYIERNSSYLVELNLIYLQSVVFLRVQHDVQVCYHLGKYKSLECGLMLNSSYITEVVEAQ